MWYVYRHISPSGKVYIDKDNNSFVFSSVREAGEALNTNASNICRAIKRNIKANGYKFYKIKQNVDE